MRLDGMIFDLDGTIGETFPMAVELIGSTIAEFGGPSLSAHEVIALFGPTEMGILEDQLGDRWQDAWDSYLARYVEMHAMCPEPFSGIREVIQLLHGNGTLLGLVTGKTALTGSLSLEVFGLADMFAAVEGGAPQGIIKADRIRRIIERWGTPAIAVAYIGDHPADVSEAKAAGTIALAAAWSEFADADLLAAEQPDALFTSVAEFKDWLRVSAQ
jgi:phosphoglycolate phosphatase-like HAD superfamily hydrolase